MGEDWPPAPAQAVGLLSELRAEVMRGRGVEILCDETACLEYQAYVDSLDFPRLPQGLALYIEDRHLLCGGGFDKALQGCRNAQQVAGFQRGAYAGGYLAGQCRTVLFLLLQLHMSG